MYKWTYKIYPCKNFATFSTSDFASLQRWLTSCCMGPQDTFFGTFNKIIRYIWNSSSNFHKSNSLYQHEYYPLCLFINLFKIADAEDFLSGFKWWKRRRYSSVLVCWWRLPKLGIILLCNLQCVGSRKGCPKIRGKLQWGSLQHKDGTRWRGMQVEQSITVVYWPYFQDEYEEKHQPWTLTEG